jgi:hypothetical protein
VSLIEFVNPTETRRRMVGDQGDWIELRRQASYGAMEKVRSASMKSMTPTAGEDRAKIDLDMSTYNIERMCAWIVAWSNPAKPNRDAFAALTEQAARIINDALDRHIKELEEEKAADGGDPTNGDSTPPLLSAVGSESPTPSY